MTSAIPANNPFGKDLFSGSTFYGRNTYGNPFASDSNISNVGFAASIWQTSENDLLPRRTQVTRNDSSYQNPRDFSSITSRAKGTFQATSNVSGRQSPTVYQGNSSSSTEPLSANSRSNNDSTILTPSTNISIADQFPLQVNTIQDSKQPRMAKQQSYHMPANAWTSAKEFRPKLSLMSDRLPSADSAPRLSATEGSSQSGCRSATFNRIWTQQDLDTGYNGLSTRSDFRPVLPATDATHNDTKFQPQARKNTHGVDRGVYENDRIFGGTAPGSHQSYYGQCNTHKHKFSAAPIKTDIRSVVGNQREDYVNGMVRNSYHNFMEKQITNYRDYQVPHSQNIHSIQLYRNDFSPEDYYRRPLEEYAAYHTSSRTDLGLQNFQQQYNQYHPGNASFAIQTVPVSSYRYSANGPQDGGDAYYMDPNSSLPYVGIDPAQERPSENQQIYRSPLLEEFRVNKSRKYELKDIHDHVVEFSGDQLGSRFIQQKLEVANSDDKDQVFSEVSRDSRQLMTDVFGNYVIQKMFEHGNQSQKKLLANHMKGHVYALSLQTYGCRVVQKAFEHILTDQQGALIKELDGNVLRVVEDQNGNHVIQKAIEMIPGEHIQFIVDAHRGHVHHLSKHPYGCRVIQRMLEYCQPHAKRQILDELHVNISDLIQDAFGNYVVQHVIVNGEPQDRKIVIDKVQSKLLENAMHKFASNVVEKALDNADEHQRRAMLSKLTGREENGQSTTTKLLTHQYGNYVIQKSTAHLTGQTLATTIQEMEDYLSQLQRVSSGKQVSALQKSILEARNRLDRLEGQRYNVNNSGYAPTHPRTAFGRR